MILLIEKLDLQIKQERSSLMWLQHKFSLEIVKPPKKNYRVGCLEMSFIHIREKDNMCNVYMILWRQSVQPRSCRVSFGMRLLNGCDPWSKQSYSMAPKANKKLLAFLPTFSKSACGQITSFWQ